MLSTSLERSALGKIWKPATFPLCCIKAPDLSVILISLPFLLPPPSLQPLIYWIAMDLFCLSVPFRPPPPPRPFFKILSKISDQRQRWCKLKSRLPRYFIRNLLFFRAILLCKTRSCVYCRALACAGRSRLAHFTELAPQNPSQRTNHCSSCLPQRWDPRRSTSIQRNSAFL